MKAAAMSNRPDFSLMKQTDIQSFYHLQMPRWLFFDPKYTPLSLEAKVTYTFLLNRFQLSKLNNWINRDGEVFIIYTRASLSKEMQISYRRVIDCMKELAAANLIWERRCGRGDANQIYLARVELTSEQASVYASAPFVPLGDEAARPAEFVCLAIDVEPDSAEDTDDLRPAESAPQDLSNLHIKTCEGGTSRPVGCTYQDLQNPHTSNIYSKNTDKSSIDCQLAGRVRAGPAVTGQTADEIAELESILEGCELDAFSPETAKVFASAIERLYFSESYRISNCVLPQARVRGHLRYLDQMKLQTAETKITRNTEKEIRNTTAYTMAVIFNSIWESESDLLNDPYLNSLRSTAASGEGRGDP